VKRKKLRCEARMEGVVHDQPYDLVVAPPEICAEYATLKPWFHVKIKYLKIFTSEPLSSVAHAKRVSRLTP